MSLLVTGSAGHLGEAILRLARRRGLPAAGLDLLGSPFTDHAGSIADRALVRRALAGATAVIHAATLHKPHVATHSRQDFIDTNISGTLVLLEEALAAGVTRFVFTSTTSAFGAALEPPPGAPAAWITEDVTPVPRNIYGVTKCAAEDLCELFHRRDGMACAVLRTSRFFPEPDDSPAVREAYADANAKANEFLHRRVDIEDAAEAHLLAAERAPAIGFGRFIVSATTPFTPDDLAGLREDAPGVVARRAPGHAGLYGRLGWRMAPSIGRVYVNARAREALGWRPAYDFARILAQLDGGEPIGSLLARQVGVKGYHGETYADGLYPVG